MQEIDRKDPYSIVNILGAISLVLALSMASPMLSIGGLWALGAVWPEFLQSDKSLDALFGWSVLLGVIMGAITRYGVLKRMGYRLSAPLLIGGTAAGAAGLLLFFQYICVRSIGT